MNCDTARRQLLASESPERPPPEVRQHLACCPTCRGLQRRLSVVERHIPLLPVPPSAGPGAVLRKLAQAPAAAERASPSSAIHPVVPGKGRGPRTREGGRQKIALAFALAAGLAAFALAWWAWPHPARLPQDPIQAELDQVRKERLASARGPHARAAALADLAGEVLVEAASADAQRLPYLARFYGEIVRDDLLEQARAAPAGERAVLVKEMTERLNRQDSEAMRSAAELPNGPAATYLRSMARAARDGNQRLQALLKVKIQPPPILTPNSSWP